MGFTLGVLAVCFLFVLGPMLAPEWEAQTYRNVFLFPPPSDASIGTAKHRAAITPPIRPDPRSNKRGPACSILYTLFNLIFNNFFSKI